MDSILRLSVRRCLRVEAADLTSMEIFRSVNLRFFLKPPETTPRFVVSVSVEGAWVGPEGVGNAPAVMTRRGFLSVCAAGAAEIRFLVERMRGPAVAGTGAIGADVGSTEDFFAWILTDDIAPPTAVVVDSAGCGATAIGVTETGIITAGGVKGAGNVAISAAPFSTATELPPTNGSADTGDSSLERLTRRRRVVPREKALISASDIATLTSLISDIVISII